MMIERAEQLVTVFGGGGFVGRYVCEALLNKGVRIRIAQRDPRQAYTVQPLAQVGQFGFVQADITDATSVRHALKGASAAINLCGAFGKAMQSVHVGGARNVAEVAAELGMDAMVQVSAIGADAGSESSYGRTKGEGEQAVREAFPNATIIRPSLVFGPEDSLSNRFASMAQLPFLPVIAGKTKFQPVYVRDLGKAIAMAALDPKAHGGKTYEIGGPQVMSMTELNQAIVALTGQKPHILAVPNLIGSALSYVGFLPGAPLTRDQWLMLQQDNVASGGSPGLDAFGIKPTPLGAVGGEWLGRFQGNRFAGRRIHLTATN